MPTHPEKFRGKYRIASARWAAWDYGSNAPYFVTICVDHHVHRFGAIVNEQMQYTALGQAAHDCWAAIPEHFPFVELDVFQVMPNHMHGIVVINKPDGPNVQRQNFAVLPAPTPTPKNQFGPQSKNLGSILRGYKIGVTKFARQHNLPFEWQERFHDHVIRNAEEWARIRQYILNNPKNWGKDKFYSRP